MNESSVGNNILKDLLNQNFLSNPNQQHFLHKQLLFLHRYSCWKLTSSYIQNQQYL